MPEMAPGNLRTFILRLNSYKNIKAKKIYIITDKEKYYKKKLVTEYLARLKIEIIFLPSYSSNLNLTERLWKFFRVFKEVLQNYKSAKI